MSLSPQTQALVDELISKGKKSYSEMSIEEWRETSDTLIELAGEPEQVREKEEIMIDGPNGTIPLYIYTPMELKNSAALIYFSGSGFVHGNNKVQDIFCRSLANATCAKIIDVFYRSAPENKYPIGVNDAYVSTRWVFDNASKLKIDRNKIGVCGYSSGGNFAALVTIMARNEKLPLLCQILVAPALDLSRSMPSHQTKGTGYILDKEKNERGKRRTCR